jgi:hypothetical protein
MFDFKVKDFVSTNSFAIPGKKFDFFSKLSWYLTVNTELLKPAKAC